MSSALRQMMVHWRNKLYHRKVATLNRTSLNPAAKIDSEVTIGEDCVVLEARIGGECHIGDRVLICKDAVVSASRIQSGCRIENDSTVVGSQLGHGVAIHSYASLCDVSVGKYSYVARETALNDVMIGSFCSIGPRCLIGTGNHSTQSISTSPVFHSAFNQAGTNLTAGRQNGSAFTEREQVRIGHDVWIGAHVFVKDGIAIGNGAILGAGAVVIKDVSPFEIVGGVPAKRIRFRFSKEVIKSIEATEWWDWSDEVLRDAHQLLASSNIDGFLKFAAENSRSK